MIVKITLRKTEILPVMGLHMSEVKIKRLA